MSVYQVTTPFPATERYVMTTQMRRAALSVLSNISEGAARGSDREFAHFLLVARGSLAELDAQVIIAKELALIREATPLEEDIALVGKLINGLLVQVRRDRSKCR